MARQKGVVFGVDIGGTGVKGAPVVTATGALTHKRVRVLTPKPSTPKRVARVVGQVVEHFGWKGPVGCTVPAVVKQGVALTAANIDPAWIGTDVAQLLGDVLGTEVAVVNDADAAGIAEMRFGAGQGRKGVVVMLTLGTGIGCGVFLDGELVPNTELGHIEIDGEDAEHLAAEIVRERDHLSWKQYAGRLQTYLERLDALLWPDLVIIGGGISAVADKYLPRVHVRPEVVPAKLHNDAGIVGAALVAEAARR